MVVTGVVTLGTSLSELLSGGLLSSGVDVLDLGLTENAGDLLGENVNRFGAIVKLTCKCCC